MSPRSVVVGVADQAVGRGDDLLTTFGLGSCIAIVLHDEEAGVGGLAHVLLPDPSCSRQVRRPERFMTTALPLLLERTLGEGADRARIQATLVGGASMFAELMTTASVNMGERNLAAARRTLEELGIPVRMEEVGGNHGRSVRFVPGEGSIRVTAALRDDVIL